ncbi:MAG: adenosylcobinamide-phosphate synthase CbiB [Lachnospiraceae bacterium]|nr:adenosylcobinamide-phosphate synthase CbiB [Lachnospiraceae bacterium]
MDTGCIIFLCLVPFISYILDLFLGEPSLLIHPVVIMGRAISFLEGKLRGVSAKTVQGEKRAGLFTVLIMLLGTLSVTCGIYCIIIVLSGTNGLMILILIDAFWGFQTIAVKSMLSESRNVYEKLSGKGLEEARKAVGRIVGRDTTELSEAGVVRAAIESVAESFSDGAAAPMLYLAVMGAPFAMAYKAVNTMDSMIGYKNERYINYGRAAARLDDVANFIPSRAAALMIIIASCICGLRGARQAASDSVLSGRDHYEKNSQSVKTSGSRAFLIWKRDRLNHESPNSAQTESAMSGALGVRLGGGAFYFGEYHDKPVIGGEFPEPAASDILRANRVFLTASLILVIICVLLRTTVIMLLKQLVF